MLAWGNATASDDGNIENTSTRSVSDCNSKLSAVETLEDCIKTRYIYQGEESSRKEYLKETIVRYRSEIGDHRIIDQNASIADLEDSALAALHKLRSFKHIDLLTNSSPARTRIGEWYDDLQNPSANASPSPRVRGENALLNSPSNTHINTNTSSVNLSEVFNFDLAVFLIRAVIKNRTKAAASGNTDATDELRNVFNQLQPILIELQKSLDQSAPTLNQSFTSTPSLTSSTPKSTNTATPNGGTWAYNKVSNVCQAIAATPNVVSEFLKNNPGYVVLAGTAVAGCLLSNHYGYKAGKSAVPEQIINVWK